jgi:hypothetical protein
MYLGDGLAASCRDLEENLSKILPIQIIHISTSHTGGAGIAARRLSGALGDAGYASHFMACANQSFIPNYNEVAIQRTLEQRLKGALLARVHRTISSKTYFTLGSIGAIEPSTLKGYSRDNSVIHVHNWFNLADIILFRKLLSKGFRLVFTLHDMRLLTGGCHYSLNCNNYLQSCGSCPFLPSLLRGTPPKNLANFRELLTQFSAQVALICPSVWLQKLAVESQILPKESIHFIPNVHNWQNQNVSDATIIQRDNPQCIDIGVASLDVTSPLKGGDFLRQVIKIASARKSQVKFVYLRDYDSRGESQEAFWENIDYLMVTSRADNSPNVIHEAKLRQVPVIATRVGGITELLNPKHDIPLDIDDLTPGEFIEMLEVLRLNLTSSRPRSIDLQYLDYVEGALQKTIAVYENLLIKS